jgi:hypothetical protein
MEPCPTDKGTQSPTTCGALEVPRELFTLIVFELCHFLAALLLSAKNTNPDLLIMIPMLALFNPPSLLLGGLLKN